MGGRAGGEADGWKAHDAMRRRTIESADGERCARERASARMRRGAAARTAERDELDSQRSSGPSDERIKTERSRNPAAAFLRRRARSGAPLPLCIIFAQTAPITWRATITLRYSPTLCIRDDDDDDNTRGATDFIIRETTIPLPSHWRVVV